MTEPTADEALVEELAWEMGRNGLAFTHARALLPIIARRDRDTWNRAIDAAVKTCRAIPHYMAENCAEAIASLKDQDNGKGETK